MITKEMILDKLKGELEMYQPIISNNVSLEWIRGFEAAIHYVESLPDQEEHDDSDLRI